MSKPPQSSSSGDRDLALRLQAGNVEALEGIYNLYAGLVYALALKMLKNAQEAEDLTQEVFVNLWQDRQYNPDRGSLKTYLMTYTRSRALDRLRVQSNRFRILRQFLHLDRPEPKEKSPLDSASEQERSQYIQTALADLPQTEREVLEIAYFEGCSQSQIATRLGIPLGTVKSRSRQGLLRLRRLLYFRSDRS